MGGRGQVLGLDIDPDRLEVGRRLTRRFKLRSVRFLQADATQPWPRAGGDPLFDAVLVDTPCTGLGVLRGRPELRWRIAADDPLSLSRLQGRLLGSAAQRVRPGGILVYASCTLTNEENREVVFNFLDQMSGFEIEEAIGYLAPASQILTTSEGFIQTWPHRHQMDGFFVARLRRSN
jgi:16S rRNA (cytosine967-C5)-methyltransferase